MSDNIKVVVKVRPLISREIEDKLSYQWRVKNNTLYQLDQNGKDLGQHSFTFDRVFDKDTKTSDVYDDIAKPIVEAATAGFNGTIFAYGQTSSGKTYTMTGTDSSPGIIPLAVINLFDIIKNVPDRDFLVRVSYIEIYNETVKDLLNGKENVKINETIQGGVRVDATERVASSPEEVLETMREGEANRQKGATNMNEQSSRSHSIFQIIIESREHVEGEEEPGCVNVSQLNLVDLAGSERSGQTGASGIRFKEGTHINKSLSALALVIKQLSEENKFANYRDSKLTRILQNSLGGNAKTSIICAITPAAVEETISTLQFANRAKAIKNKPEVNAVVTADSTMIQRLTKQMCELKTQLESKKSIEQDNYKLQSKIASLQKLILNGFAQRRSVDQLGGARRKLQQPRRVTISTLHSIDDEPVVSIPKFCTPSLKYNPITVQKPGDSAPITNDTKKLPSVPEEPARLVTPPPTRKVFFNDEIIDLDSDDEASVEEVQTCSPFHKCHDSTKTPPCILRRNAKEAEKNLKGILELTEREKMYSPTVVEYIEKLEQNTAVIERLQDQVATMIKQSKDKDTEVEFLRSKIKKTEEDLKALSLAKAELQSQCNTYNTRLTDAEVSYETLRNKAKLREEELLSLLEEINAKNKNTEDMGKIMSRTLDKELHFMDMSKDISLVNSDSESIVQANDDEPDQLSDLVAETQSQMNIKNQTIIDLEANIFAHQQKISSLENLNQELQEKVSTFQEKLTYMENENSLLKSTIDTLNVNIKDQKEHLETANHDIDSYNSVIQELQIKLTQKENLPTIKLDDSALENMIGNEEKFLASNENMRNIIHSLRIALDTRNKELKKLKTTAQSSTDLTIENITLKEQIETRTKEVNTLYEEIDNLKKQITENITVINRVMHEKNDFKVIEQSLSEKLITHEQKTSELERCNREYAISLKRLEDENFELKLSLSEKSVAEQEMSEINKQLSNEIQKLTENIAYLEKEISEKDVLISSLNKEDKSQAILNAKAAVVKLQLILGTLSGNMQEVPEIIDNFVNIFSALSDSMNTLENVANEVVRQKTETFKNNEELKNKLEKLTSKYNTETSALREELNGLSESESKISFQNDNLNEKLNQLSNELEKTSSELATKISENKSLETYLNQATENVQSCNKIIATLEAEKENLEQTLHDWKNKSENLTKRLEELEIVIKNKTLEINVLEERLNNSQQERDDLLNSILRKMNEFTNSFNIQNDNSEEDCANSYKRILLTLGKIGNHITFISSTNADGDNHEANETLLEAKKEILGLSEQNLVLIEQLSEVESKRSELSFEVKRIQEENKHLNKELLLSQGILEKAQIELKLKADELTEMEHSVREWKEQFINLDSIIKQQMYELKLENENLKSRIATDPHKPGSKSIVKYEHRDDIDSQEEGDRKTSDISVCGGLSTPPSLLTICCDKIVNYIQPKEIDSRTTTISSNAPEPSVKSDKTYTVKCKCETLTLELETAREENSKIMELVQQMEAVNQHLIQEQEAVRNEIQHLIAPAQELQKKIVNHKTNLSILTATTYAENWSLKSQVKVLQHHHSRFHNVCQRDLPDFRKLLRELLILLKGDPSIADQQNASFKRFSLPDVLDSSTALPNFKNDSTLDGDLLMLDTNVTLTTAADNTLTGHDQTCLDLTQFYNEAPCQTNDLNQTSNQNTQDLGNLSYDNEGMKERLHTLKGENEQLRELVQKYMEMKQSITDAQTSPIKNVVNKVSKSDNNSVFYECDKCKNLAELQHTQDKLKNDLKSLNLKLENITSQKSEIEQKYNNLVLETPLTDTLVKKLSILEKDYDSKIKEIAKLNNTLSIKTEQITNLQDENNTLSTQVMESISEADDLNKELDNLKTKNKELLEKCSKLEQTVKEISEKIQESVDYNCVECTTKDEIIKEMQTRLTNTHTRLSRSLSDSDTSSRYNKICTLQSELHAGREDCEELTEDVVTIKNHFDRSNLAMDLDDSMGESQIYSSAKDFAVSSPQSNKCYMPDIPEEHPSEIYLMDKMECVNYLAEKTGVEKDKFNRDVKIIDVMKMLHEHLITKHGNEVENLTNKLKDYDESKSQLQIQINTLMEKHSQVTIELEQKGQNYNAVEKALSQIKSNIRTLNEEIVRVTDIDISNLVNMYKDNFFKVLDNELGLSSMKIIESLIDNIVKKHETDLNGIMEQYSNLKAHMDSVTKELNSVNENLARMKNQLSAKENEYNLLKAQKERIHEISNAVTLDIVKKDKELTKTISDGYEKLVELNIVDNQNVDMTLSLNDNVNLLFDLLTSQYKNRIDPDLEKEKENLMLEVKNAQRIIEKNQKEIEQLKAHCKNLQEINNVVTIDLVNKEKNLKEQQALHDDLNKMFESKVMENKANVELIEKMSEEVKLLKATVEEKQKTIEALEIKINIHKEKEKKLAELKQIVKELEDEITHLKALNDVIVKEKDTYAVELLKSGETLKQNNIEMDKMTSDILILRESVRENSIVIENLNMEAKNLLKQNMELKGQLEEKSRENFRLETNMKTHEKTAEIQTRMIMRLEKQKNDDDKIISEKSKEIEELKVKCAALQMQCDVTSNGAKDKDELEHLRKCKESLEARVSELEAQLEGHKSRPSIDAIADSSRRRRQSLHDSKRLFGDDRNEFEDQNNVEAVFDSRPKPDDLFMDVDEDVSNRSSPIRLSKGRESFSLSKTDQSDKDEEHPSRPSSVVATRRRRQSIHDLHRSVLRHTPSPHGLDASPKIIDEFNHSKPSDVFGGQDSELNQLRERLASCQQELEDLKEKYRELDEECETCAEYLRERDEQCGRLKKERAALQVTISELKENLQSCNPNMSKQNASKPSVGHVGVNTDEDWANLHSVVVDRMSFDAEVEKNKKLTKTIEELRFKKQDLKNTLAKMQKALEKNNNRELESTRHELQACKQELLQLREKYKELDDECETCAQYLREKEEQCRRLKEAKNALEVKLQEYQSEVNAMAHSARKKRQSAHDQNRPSTVDVQDAATETSDDFLSYQVERDGSHRPLSDDMQAKETKRLKMVIEKLSQQKAILEQQLVSMSAMHAAHPAMYVATGSAIVQNQQLTDVMKENQKLKKINAKLINICKKRGKDSNRENEDPADQG